MNKIILFLLLISSQIFPQIDNPLDYFPHHVGDTWQYRSQFTGEIVGTRYIDSVSVDSVNKDIFIYYGHYNYSGTNLRYRIDSLGNLYNLNFNPDGIRYKLYAESGDSWILRDADSVNMDTVIVRVVNTYNTSIFGVSTTVKAFQFELHFPNMPIFWLGIDHLAKGFGLVRSDIEPSDVYVLTGAIIDSIQYGIITSVEKSTEIKLPNKYLLHQNYPNPFNPTTKIKFTIPRLCEQAVADANFASTTKIILNVYDVLGKEITTLVDEQKPPGNYELDFDGSNLPSGIYFYSITSGKLHDVKKMILMK